MNFTSMLYMMMLIMGIMVTISSNNWLGMWMGLELNLMSFIPLISKSKNMKSSQAMMIYFMTQSAGSIVLLFSILLNKYNMQSLYWMNELTMMMMIYSLILKLGAAPFHFWFPEMMSKLNWKECGLLMTLQKIGPMCILSNNMHYSIYLSVILSTMMGAVGGLNQTSLRKIMAYSSINHLGWMIAFMMTSVQWYKYLLVYSIIVISMIYMFHNWNIYFINQMMNMNNSMMEKYTITTMMMSLGGMPPFLGFLPKLMVIMNMISTKMMFTMIIMMMFSLVTLFYYMRMINSLLLLNTTMNKWNKNIKLKKNFLFMIMLLNLSLPLAYMIF
uniref:NADH-ubiquinone oxidoreductase chain 2 n=1 Tax=Stenophyella macreta TaxID=2813424 RepID=A0A8T9ZWC0_9HEMI|nr:NADH dehydrogenase subunit 2 [Stenophyella macreta]